ncbi:hypothetical protein BH09DEP1_BH09DEP1_5800 [soil metagenome]
MQCDHTYCTNCLKQLIKQVIASENSTGLRCPAPACKKPFAQTQIQSLIPRTSLQTKLNHIQFQEWLMQEKNRIACPTPNCPFIFINERTDQFTMQCPSCDSTYCARCLHQHSANISCKEAVENKQITTDTKEQEEASAQWKAQNTRPCPGCKTAIEKTEGCNHMNCQKCRHQFCWQCMNPWAHRGHGPFGCSLAQPQSVSEVRPQEIQEPISAANAHLFFARDPLGFKNLLTQTLEHAQFAERFKQLSCEKQDEWAARVSNQIERSRASFIIRDHAWLKQLETVEGHREDNQDSDSDDENPFNHMNLPPMLLEIMQILNHMQHNHPNSDSD